MVVLLSDFCPIWHFIHISLFLTCLDHHHTMCYILVSSNKYDAAPPFQVSCKYLRAREGGEFE